MCRVAGGLTWTLQQAVRVQCSAMQLTASLPAPLADALGVTGLYLSDRGCSGRRNATHWSITSRVTSCGSTLRIGEKLTTYSNLVIFNTITHSFLCVRVHC